MISPDAHVWGTAPEFVGPRHDLRERLLLDLLIKAEPGSTVLNAGAGQGTLTKRLDALGFDVVSTDITTPAVQSLQRISSRVAQADTTRLPFRSGHFDAVVLGEVLEHIPDDRQALRETARVLRPKGVVVISVPRNPAWFGPSDAWAGHVRRYTRPRLLSAFEETGLDVERCLPWGFPVSALYHRRVYEPRLAQAGGEVTAVPPRALLTVLRLALQLDRAFVGIDRGALGYLLAARKADDGGG